MKVVLDVKNGSKLLKPSKDNIIIYDGKDYYVTTRQELFGEYESLVNGKIQTIEREKNEIKEDNEAFKKEVSEQIVKITKIVKTMYENNN